MWLDEADSFSEIFRGYLPYYLLVALPIFIIMSPAVPVSASHEFSTYRMQQYDLHGEPHGCRSASFNLEGRSLHSWSTARHCVVARIQDITIEQFLEIRGKAGALLILLPKNISALTDEERENIQLLEMVMNQQEITAPVYFLQWSPEFEDILNDMEDSSISNDKSGTALEALINSISSNGYQMVVSAPSPARIDARPSVLVGRLAGAGSGAGGGTVLVIAHYDAAAVAPELALGADSNASGAAALLELARVMSRLYAGAARPAGSLLFLLTAAGPALNYFAAKRWLEDQLDAADASLLQDISFVMNLESISGNELGVQVSKPPRGGPAGSIISRLKVPVTHKKINLADERLAWQHERFSIRRITAFTLTTLKSHKSPSRSSLLDTYSERAVEDLISNTKVTARALASHLYNLTLDDNDEDAALYDDALGVDPAAIRHWYRYLSQQARAPAHTSRPGDTGVTGALQRALARYTDTTRTEHAPDQREPDFVLYSPTVATLYVYSVKPAVFDLILTIIILAYLGIVYLAMQMFPRFYQEFSKIVVGKYKQQ